jgi:dihydroorotase
MAINSAVFVSTKVVDDKACYEKTEELLCAYGERAVGVKLYFDTTGGQVHSIEPLRQICDFARARGLKVMVHCSHSPVPMYEIIDTLSEGDILTHIYHGGENGCEENGYAAFRLAREKGIILDLGMAGHVHTDFRVLERAVKCGQLPDTISTDITNLSAFTRGGIYGLLGCMSIMKNAGACEKDILRMVGENAARAVGKQTEWGKLEVGRRADVAVLEWTDAPYAFLQNENNIIAGEQGYICKMTVCGGRVVYRR